MSPEAGKTAKAKQRETLKGKLEHAQELFKKTGHCYGVKKLSLKEKDPIKYELFHSRVLSTVLAARDMAKMVSSSVMAREEGELCFAVFTPEGDSIAFSTGLMIHIGLMGGFIRWMIEHDYEEDPGFNEGDHFANNDAMISAIHTPDVYFVTPVYVGDDLVAWVGGVTHVLEVGGLTPGSASSGIITERCQEGLHVTGEHVARNDRLKRDYEMRIQLNTRYAPFWLLDDRARIAGNVYIRGQVKKIIEEFGMDYFREASKEFVEESRRHHTLRIKEKMIPGRYRSATFMDVFLKGKLGVLPTAQKDNIIHIPVEMKIDSSGRLALDLEGASPEGRHNWNSRACSLFGGLSITLAQMLHFDGKANDGSLKDIDLHAPLGTVGNAKDFWTADDWSWGIIHMTYNQVIKYLGRAYFSRGYVEEVFAGGNHMVTLEMGGKNQHGQLFGGCVADMVGSGSGARGVMDGITTAWQIWNPEGDQGNAEMWELVFPFLYLGRRIGKDACGAGRYRSGGTYEMVWMVNDSDFCYFSQIGTHSAFFPNISLFGGYPPPVGFLHLAKDTDMKERIDNKLPLPYTENELALLSGTVKTGLDRAYVSEPLKTYDLVATTYCTGGGLGDPLDRDPQMVSRDLTEGFISSQSAEQVYGVKAFFDESDKEWKVDAEGTKSCRTNKKSERLARGIPVKEWWKTQRERVQSKRLPELVLETYKECMALSPHFTSEFRKFWALDETWTM